LPLMLESFRADRWLLFCRRPSHLQHIGYHRLFSFWLIFLGSSGFTYQILQTKFNSKLRMGTQCYQSIFCLLPYFLKIICDLINQVWYYYIAIYIKICLHRCIKVYLRIAFTHRLCQLDGSLQNLGHFILNSKSHSSYWVYK
jgi:hypothetical protein